MTMGAGFNFEKDSAIVYDDVVDEMDRELEEMLQRAATNGEEITFEDFYNIMTKKTF